MGVRWHRGHHSETRKNEEGIQQIKYNRASIIINYIPINSLNEHMRPQQITERVCIAMLLWLLERGIERGQWQYARNGVYISSTSSLSDCFNAQASPSIYTYACTYMYCEIKLPNLMTSNVYTVRINRSYYVQYKHQNVLQKQYINLCTSTRLSGHPICN